MPKRKVITVSFNEQDLEMLDELKAYYAASLGVDVSFLDTVPDSQIIKTLLNLLKHKISE